MHLPKGYILQNGKYRLTDVIGQGGFGITYSGVWSTEVKGNLGTVRTDVPICIKEYFFKDYCLRDNDTMRVKVHSETGKILFEKFREKLIKEAKILSEVHHPYIVNVLEVFEENETAYIAMEYIQGCSLKYMLDKEGVLPEKKVLKYVSQIGQALEFVHQKNILHLDIKPNNILIDRKNNARLIDFGVSKRYDIEQQETSTTMLTVSKGFASIEQYDTEGIQNFTPCPDVYSLGATMYNLLTGVVPTESILRATKPITNPSELNKEITPRTEQVILRAMQINPSNRYQSIKQMLNELDIPSYFEETENELTEGHSDTPSSEEETEDTMLRREPQAKNNDPDNEDIKKYEAKKKRKRRILIPIFIIFTAFVGWAVTFILDRDNVKKGELTDTSAVDTTATIVQENNLAAADPVANEPETTASEKTGDTPKANQPVTTGNEQAKADNAKTSEAKDITPATDDGAIEKQYADLIAGGKAKMEQKKYAEAKSDFTKAKELKVTEEAVRLIVECDEREAEQQIAARRALYEEKFPFGTLIVVRKISTGRYGAIDSKGLERIKAEYLSVAPSANGRAFEREDHLYDIYDANGAKIGNGLTSY